MLRGALVQGLEGRAEEIHDPIKRAGTVATTNGLYEPAAEHREAGHDLFPRALGPVPGALARYTGLLQPFGTVPEALGALQVRSLRPEVLADHTGGTSFERHRDRRLLSPMLVGSGDGRPDEMCPRGQEAAREPCP